MMNRNNNAQVGVVVAILMVSLLVAVMVLIQVHYVPAWMKEKEANHMDAVADQFSNLKASVDLQAMSQIDAPISHSITLGSKELPFFVSSRAFGSFNILSTTSSDFSISITLQAGMKENFHRQSMQPPDSVSYVSSISGFELVIDTLKNGDVFNVTLNDESDNTIEVNVLDDGASTFRINLKTVNNTNILFNQTIASGIPSQEQFRINLLNPDYKFATDVLPYVTTPFNLSVGASNPDDGNFSIKCYKYDSTAANPTYNLGTMSYQSNNAYFVDQTYVYEGGAVILKQHDGQAIISPPFFDIINYTTRHVINMSIVNIIGMAGKTSASGYGTYSIRTNYSGYTDYKAIAKSVTIRINTDYPSAWYRYLNSTIRNSGITNYSITPVNESSNYVSISTEGPLNGSSHDIYLSIKKIDIYAQVGPGWVT